MKKKPKVPIINILLMNSGYMQTTLDKRVVFVNLLSAAKSTQTTLVKEWFWINLRSAAKTTHIPRFGRRKIFSSEEEMQAT